MKVYSTRFQGSKRRLLPWVIEAVEERAPSGGTVLDAFSGSGVVSYALAEHGFSVAGADRLLSAEIALRAFIGNRSSLGIEEVLGAVRPAATSDPLFRSFRDRFFPDPELRWLLGAASWGRSLRGDRRTAFFWALFQSSLAKRPYNLFHRANLDMRTRDVERSFGNARTWERPFPELLEKFLREQAKLRLPDANRPSFYLGDLFRMPAKSCDLVYLDPPYIPARGESIDYLDFYGFLDLLLKPDLVIDRSRPHRPIKHQRSFWERRDRFEKALHQISVRYRDVPLLFSYRKDGFPNPKRIKEILGPGTEVREQPIHYALAKSGSAELLFLRPPL